MVNPAYPGDVTRPRRPTTKPKNSPVSVIRPDPAVWRRALDLADGDARRLSVAADGTVLVRNLSDR